MVYRCWEGESLLYIGRTSYPDERFRKHAQASPWWHRVTEVTVDFQETRAASILHEGLAIRAEAPLLNIRHNLDNIGRAA